MEANGGSPGTRWEGTQTAKLKGVAAETAWSALEDFCNLHKWFPEVDTCEYVSGVHGQPGLVRYCASTKKDDLSGGGPTEEGISWAKERLLSIDPERRCLSYDILENNIGFRSYVATFRVIPVEEEGNGGQRARGCAIEWSFVADPVEGWRAEDLESYVGFCLKYMAEKMESSFPGGEA